MEIDRQENIAILNEGKWANARVWSSRLGDGEWVVKDFTQRNTFVRWTLGWFLTRRECSILRHLKMVDGVPQDVECTCRNKLKYTKLPGNDLARLKKKGICLADQFFKEVERMVYHIHQRGVVHLDLRKAANILCCDDGRPAIIDFQSAVYIDHLPRWLQRWLKSLDYSGVYKHWKRMGHAARIGERRKRLADNAMRWKRFWWLRSYPWKRISKLFGKDGQTARKSNDF